MTEAPPPYPGVDGTAAAYPPPPPQNAYGPPGQQYPPPQYPPPQYPPPQYPQNNAYPGQYPPPQMNGAFGGPPMSGQGTQSTSQQTND